MATPTPSSQPPNPSSASKRPGTAYNAPTPLAQGTSPAQHQQPRSHPSPTATRTAAKTPINHPTATPTNHPTASSTRTFGGTPMVQTLSQQGFGTASPSGAIMGPNGTPSGMAGLGLGVDLLGTPGAMATTPSGMGLGLNMGMGMMPSMSELGLSLTASGGHKRDEDEERRAKMRQILKKIGRPRGRVSEEGICRVGRRVGFANDIDHEIRTQEDRKRLVGNRTVSIAGEAVVVDVDMKEHVPKEVQVMMSGEEDVLAGLAEKAGEVLLESMRGTNGLAGFAKGLDWIARIDRLGGSKVNGFEALGGIFGCLRRLYDEEVRLVVESGKGSRERAETTAMCKKSGKPVAHERGGLGISLDYWQDDRAALIKKAKENDMEIDSAVPATTNNSTTVPGLHTLHVDLDRCPPEMYPPIRISSTWLPEKLTLDPTTPGNIPWQETDATFLSTGNSNDNSMTDNNVQQKLLPSLRFLAHLDPPIVMPWQTATLLLTSVGAVPPQPFTAPLSFHHILLPTSTVLGGADIEQRKKVLLARPGQAEGEATHVYRLHVAKPDFGFRLEEMPFAHPRQLVEDLPVLRQWGCFGALVRDVFDGGSGGAVASSASLDGVRGGLDSTGNSATTSQQEDVATAADKDNSPISIDVSLATAPQPVLSLAFPSLDGERTIAVELAVGLSGDISVSGRAGGKTIEGKRARRWARGLEVCGIVGVWVEWVRGEERGE